DLDAVISEARASAEVTHAHAEGIAGAVAVAVAAAGAHQGLRGRDLLDFVIANTPEGDTRDGLGEAISLLPSTPVRDRGIGIRQRQRRHSAGYRPLCVVVRSSSSR